MKNIVFDFGQVIVHFEPLYIVKKFVSDPDDALLLEGVIFDRLYFDALDAGTLSDEEVICAFKKRLPERLRRVSEDIYYSWIYNIPEIEGMSELIAYVKEKYGVSVFLLSNISSYFADHSDEISVLKLFDKCIFSSKCGMVKPNRDIFEYLCNECNIVPEETLLVDDRAENIEGAQKIGIIGYLFDGSVSSLRLYLDNILGT